MVEGWIFDLYPAPHGQMVVWLKTPQGRQVQLVDQWHHRLYVAADDVRDLQYLATRAEIAPFLASTALVWKRELAEDYAPRQVLELVLEDATQAERLAETIERLAEFGAYRLYNVDVRPEQAYLFEKDLFTLAYVGATQQQGHIVWGLRDSVAAEDYTLPPLTKVELHVEPRSARAVPSFRDPIAEITLKTDGETLTIAEGAEGDKLLGLVEAIQRFDPDLLFIANGDTFTTHYLVERAFLNSVLERFTLSRNSAPLRRLRQRGTSYFAYGRILYTPSSHRLYGRINLDRENYFSFGDIGLHGLFEIVRLTRMPIHKASRASIGKCLSSMQFYFAYHDNLLIPWKPGTAEVFKTGAELLQGDRGGFIFEPKLGVFDEVGEIDFASLYATIMWKKNISAETVLCACCPTSPNRVPELDYHICERRVGIVPRSLELPIQKRAHYKQRRDRAQNPEERRIFASRVEALKGILVCSFGYLSYRNAKFGKIDSHMAVCAFDRQVLLQSARICERRGFEIIHGIVDSLWVRKPGATRADFIEVCQEIEGEVGFPLSFEGRYRWVVFLPSRMYDGVPVLNRYFGVFEDGAVKVRGIELRRSDAIQLVAQCQEAILGELAQAPSLAEVPAYLPRALTILQEYGKRVRQGQVSIPNLTIVNRLSKNYDQYSNNTNQAVAIRHLADEGLGLMAGQAITYVVTHFTSPNPEAKALPIQLAGPGTPYDRGRYLDLLARGVATLLQPFGYDEKFLRHYLRASVVPVQAQLS